MNRAYESDSAEDKYECEFRFLYACAHVRVCVSHEVWALVVDEGAQGEAGPPGCSEVSNIYSSVALRLLLTPQQQAAGTHLRF